jgi:hypothetical protein
VTTKIYCPCCGRFIGDCNSSDNHSIVKATTDKPVNKKNQSCYITNKCKGCKSDIYILMEFKNQRAKRTENALVL